MDSKTHTEEVNRAQHPEYQKPMGSVDGGIAWIVLLGSCLSNAFFNGLLGSIGVLYVEMQEKLNASLVDVSIIGSLRSGFTSVLVVFTSPLAKYVGCRQIAVIGGLLSSVSYFICAFVESIYAHQLLLGAIAGIANAMVYASSVVAVNTYFIEKRPFALAMMQVFCSLGSLSFAPLTSVLLDAYGLYGCLLINAGLALNMVVFAFLYLQQQPSNRKEDNSDVSLCQLIWKTFGIYRMALLWKGLPFYLMTASNIMNGFSLYNPQQLLPDYMVVQGISLSVAALSISTMGASTAVSRFLAGIVVNKYKALTFVVYMGGLILSGIAVYGLTGRNSSTGFMVFSTLFGFLYGFPSAVEVEVLVDLFGAEHLPASFGIIHSAQGFGALFGAPVASAVAVGADVTGIEFMLTASVMIASGLVVVPIMILKRRKNADSEKTHLLQKQKYVVAGDSRS